MNVLSCGRMATVAYFLIACKQRLSSTFVSPALLQQHSRDVSRLHTGLNDVETAQEKEGSLCVLGTKRTLQQIILHLKRNK